MLQKIKTRLNKPLNKKTIILTIVILIVVCLGLPGVLFQRYQIEINRGSPVFTGPTPFELLQSRMENTVSWIEELRNSLNRLDKEVEEIKKAQEAQEELARSFIFIDPTTSQKIYVN